MSIQSNFTLIHPPCFIRSSLISLTMTVAHSRLIYLYLSASVKLTACRKISFGTSSAFLNDCLPFLIFLIIYSSKVKNTYRQQYILLYYYIAYLFLFTLFCGLIMCIAISIHLRLKASSSSSSFFPQPVPGPPPPP